mgnify:CR=1 FL=1
MNIPRVMIAAPSSGSGKTLVTCAILRLLQRQGLALRSFKCGPDFIDTLFHSRVLSLSSINIDTYFTGDELSRALFVENAAGGDFAVIEGVMGFFDGVGGISLQASSADLARVTQTPVILVVDASGMSRSVVALAKGFCDYDSQHLIRGLILNKVSPQLFGRYKKLIEEELHLPVLGCLPACPQYAWKSRHLGLLLPEEISGIQQQIDGVADLLAENLDLARLNRIAHEAPALDCRSADRLGGLSGDKPYTGLRIAVARDEAFCFYYADNLRLLQKQGAELIFFSPLHDSSLPAADGALLGGGYPELHAAELEENSSLRLSLKQAVRQGLPLLAECGGFLYAQDSLCDQSGRTFAMAGIIEGHSWYTGKLVRFGYAEFTEKQPPAGDALSIRGHEFHYFDSSNNGTAYRARKASGGKEWNCMVSENSVLAGFPHLYYYAEPRFALRFLESCRH